MDRAFGCGPKGCRFDSCRGHHGGVPEWLNGAVLKTARSERASEVRILSPPPNKIIFTKSHCILQWDFCLINYHTKKRPEPKRFGAHKTETRSSSLGIYGINPHRLRPQIPCDLRIADTQLLTKNLPPVTVAHGQLQVVDFSSPKLVLRAISIGTDIQQALDTEGDQTLVVITNHESSDTSCCLLRIIQVIDDLLKSSGLLLRKRKRSYGAIRFFHQNGVEIRDVNSHFLLLQGSAVDSDAGKNEKLVYNKNAN